VAVAYGYNNIKKTIPKTATIGAQVSRMHWYSTTWPVLLSCSPQNEYFNSVQ
jgi:hypothetical protein